MGKFFDMALLWVVHFLQTPEGQTILQQAENELTADIQADAAETGTGSVGGNMPLTPPPPVPTPGTPQTTIMGYSDPKKRSSATAEQA